MVRTLEMLLRDSVRRKKPEKPEVSQTQPELPGLSQE